MAAMATSATVVGSVTAAAAAVNVLLLARAARAGEATAESAATLETSLAAGIRQAQFLVQKAFGIVP